MMKTLPLLVALSTLTLISCSEAQSPDAQTPGPAPAAAQPQGNDTMPTASETSAPLETLTGTIVYKSFEGGFYAFDADNGKPYTLRDLAEAYRKNGLKVRVTGRPMPEVMTFTQYGTVFKVDSIEVLDDSQVKPAADTY